MEGYHYHAALGCSDVITSVDGHANLIGYALDGYGIYAMLNSTGEEDYDLEEKLDPVGEEDEDVDNDGDVDSSDKYLKKRRQAIGKAMKKESLDSIRALIQKELKNL